MISPARVFFLSLIFSIAIGKSIKQKGSKDDSKSSKEEVEVREMPCVSNFHCEAGKICQMGKCAVSKDSKDGREEKDSGEDNKSSLKSGDLFQSKTEKKVDSKCCAPTKRQLENYDRVQVTSCFDVKFDPSDLEKKDIVVNGMPFSKTSRKSDDEGSYIRYTGDEYMAGKGYIDKFNEKSRKYWSGTIGHFRMVVGDNEYTDFELNKCKDSFIFKQLEYDEHDTRNPPPAREVPPPLLEVEEEGEEQKLSNAQMDLEISELRDRLGLNEYLLDTELQGLEGEKGAKLRKLLREYDEKHHPGCSATNRAALKAQGFITGDTLEECLAAFAEKGGRH